MGRPGSRFSFYYASNKYPYASLSIGLLIIGGLVCFLAFRILRA